MNNEVTYKVENQSSASMLTAAVNHVRLLQKANEDAKKRNINLHIEMQEMDENLQSYDIIRQQYYSEKYKIRKEDERITGEWRMLYRIAKSVGYSILYSADTDQFQLKEIDE